MPVRIPSSLPAVEELKSENIFVIDEQRASSQDIRPLRIAVLNLMPLKIMTETDLLRLLSNTPLQIELDLIEVDGHESKNTPREHLDTFYKKFDDVKSSNYDGFIITGAPVEKMDFEDVDYWGQLEEIFSWAKTHVTSTLYICWAGLAGLYYRYGIKKILLDKKLSGVFEHKVYNHKNPIFRGFDDVFYAPHSRHSTLLKEDVLKHDELEVISEGDQCCSSGQTFPDIFFEYKRDLGLGLNPHIPDNYYEGNNPENEVIVRWRSHANLLYSNWLNYFVYQETPYDIRNIK